MRYFKSSIKLIIYAVGYVLVLGQMTTAQSVGLAPAQIVEKFKPGVPFQLDLSTVNNGSQDVEMSVEITDLWYNDRNEKTFSAPGTSPRSAANWIQFVPEKFRVPAGGTQKMKAIVTPPADARGGYYAVLFVNSKPELSFDKKDGKQVYTKMRLGCLVLLSADKTEDFKTEITNLKLAPPSANQGLSLDFDLLNAGNTHIFPFARLAVLDAKHKLVAKADNQEEVKRFLPGQKNSVHVGWAGVLPPGEYTAVLTLSYGEDRVETQQVPFTVPEKQ
jgi:hypothetical protein